MIFFHHPIPLTTIDTSTALDAILWHRSYINTLQTWFDTNHLEEHQLKSTITLLINYTKEHQHTPQLTLDCTVIPHKRSTNILGVTYDTSLSFKDQIHDIKQKYRHRLNMLLTLTGTDFGQHKEALTHMETIHPLDFEICKSSLGPKPCNNSQQHSTNHHWLHTNCTNKPPMLWNKYSHYKTILTCEGHNF